MADSDVAGGEDGWSPQDIGGEDIFINFLKSNRSLLTTSSTPGARASKIKDLEKLVKIYAENGVERTMQQIRKAINNLRNRVKSKLEKRMLTDRPSKLSPLEQRFYELLDAENEPHFLRPKFGIFAGAKSESAFRYFLFGIV